MENKLLEFLKLQKIDIDISDFKKTFENIPKEIDVLENKISTEEIKINNLNDKISVLEKELDDYNSQIETIDTKIKNQEDKLFTINSNKEFEALQKETGDLKRLKIEIEDKQLKTMENLELSKGNLNNFTSQFQTDIEPLKEEIKKLENNLKECNEKKETLIADRNQITKTLDENILIQYESLLEDNPPVIVSAIGETCGQCFLTIPPQTYIKVLQQKEIVNCPHCRKILIPEENNV